jgi:hypothetical protein
MLSTEEFLPFNNQTLISQSSSLYYIHNTTGWMTEKSEFDYSVTQPVEYSQYQMSYSVPHMM